MKRLVLLAGFGLLALILAACAASHTGALLRRMLAPERVAAAGDREGVPAAP